MPSELYDVTRWGNGYVSVRADGHLMVHPNRDPHCSIDLKELIDSLQLRGIDLPILVRFADVLKHRLSEIHSAFAQAMKDHQFKGDYFCVYPIKVNQQRQVVEEVLNFGKPFHFGLEAGSKPELLAVVALASNDTPIICNGFKDAEFIEMAMLAQKIGRRVIPVVEKYTELGLILDYAAKVGVCPSIGMRVKLAAKAGGRWQGSGGFRSKFGLTVTEILRALEELKQRGMQDCFKLLHFHLGSSLRQSAMSCCWRISRINRISLTVSPNLSGNRPTSATAPIRGRPVSHAPQSAAGHRPAWRGGRSTPNP